MKTTPLTSIHESLGAKMAPFAGYLMPISYSGINEEHRRVRESAGMFDVSHMGEFIIEGPGALELIQWVTTNDASKLSSGKVQYSCLPNEKGGIVDDLLVYMLGHNRYMLVVNASNIEKDRNWILSQNRFDATLTDISDDTALLAVQGPKALSILQKLTDVDLEAIPYYHFGMGRFAGFDDVILSNTGYTGAGGFEIYVPNVNAAACWNAIMEAGKAYGILPCGLGARDTLRLEKGFCLYGNDINDETSPIEAGLGWITRFSKPFVHHEFHRSLKENGPAKKLCGFEMTGRGIPRQHYKILSSDGTLVGEVTSGTQSPSLNRAIGMGYVAAEFSHPGQEIMIEIRNQPVAARVVKLPFL